MLWLRGGWCEGLQKINLVLNVFIQFLGAIQYLLAQRTFASIKEAGEAGKACIWQDRL